MSNVVGQFPFQDKEPAGDLYSGLRGILNRIKAGAGIPQAEREKILLLIDRYVDALIKTDQKNFEPYLKLTNGTGISFDEKTVLSELRGRKNCIEILIRMGCEKLIPYDNAILETDEAKFLIEKGYCREIVTDESERCFYVLSSKGNKCFHNKNVTALFKQETKFGVFPSGMISDVSKWSNIYGRRLNMLCDYFNNCRESAEYIVFTLDEAKELAFGCELGDSLKVRYLFACVFDHENKQTDIEQLKGLAGSGLIDELILLVESVTQKEELINEKGLNPQVMPQLSYYVMD